MISEGHEQPVSEQHCFRRPPLGGQGGFQLASDFKGRGGSKLLRLSLSCPSQPEEKSKFDGIFESLIPTGGLLSGEKVRPVLINSKLPLDVLGKVLHSVDQPPVCLEPLKPSQTAISAVPLCLQVWDLSDIDKDGHLDRDEFAVVSFDGGRGWSGSICSMTGSSTGHAPGLSGLGEGARPCSPSPHPRPSIQKEEKRVLCTGTSRKPPTSQRLATLHPLPRQHDLAQQRRQPVA